MPEHSEQNDMTEENIGPASAPAAVEGLTDAAALGLERTRIRTRENSVTLSAWRLAVRSVEGDGAIVVVEQPGKEPIYRGEGTLLGWSQDRLAGAYEALKPRPEEPEPESLQLG
jgi:hypothetical protein